MTETVWRWVQVHSVLAMHEEQLAEHAGMAGIRDLPLLLSALARPRNLVAYGTPDIADLAASCAFGIARNHAFLDGNKPAAWVVMETFLLKNGFELVVDDYEGVATMLSVAGGSISESEFASWIRRWIQPFFHSL